MEDTPLVFLLMISIAVFLLVWNLMVPVFGAERKAAKRLKISRPTFSRIIASAHNKIADAFVNTKAIKIEGGCCKITRRKK